MAGFRGLLDALRDPKNSQGLLDMGVSLMGASGPSPVPMSFGQRLAQGYVGSQQMAAERAAQLMRQKQMELQQQVAEAQLEKLKQPPPQKSPVDGLPVEKYTPASVQKFAMSGNYADLEPVASQSGTSSYNIGAGGALVDGTGKLLFRNPARETAPQVRYVNTPNGTLRVDGDGTEQILEATKPGGSSGRPMPQGLAGDLKANAQVISMIDEVMPKLKTPEGKRATGARNAVISMLTPDAISDNVKNVADPKGTEVRSLVTNLNSFIVKERNGAAVTVAEFARQRGFLPTDSDGTEVIATKLAKLKKSLVDENTYIADFAESQGYRRPPTGVNRGMQIFPNGSPEAAQADSAQRGGSNESDPLGLR